MNNSALGPLSVGTEIADDINRPPLRPLVCEGSLRGVLMLLGGILDCAIFGRFQPDVDTLARRSLLISLFQQIRCGG